MIPQLNCSVRLANSVADILADHPHLMQDLDNGRPIKEMTEDLIAIAERWVDEATIIKDARREPIGLNAKAIKEERDAIQLLSGKGWLGRALVTSGQKLAEMPGLTTPMMRALHSPSAKVRDVAINLYRSTMEVAGLRQVSVEAIVDANTGTAVRKIAVARDEAYHAAREAGYAGSIEDFDTLVAITATSGRMPAGAPKEITRVVEQWRKTHREMGKLAQNTIDPATGEALLDPSINLDEPYWHIMRRSDALIAREQDWKASAQAQAERHLVATHQEHASDLANRLGHINDRLADFGIQTSEIDARLASLYARRDILNDEGRKYEPYQQRARELNDQIAAIREGVGPTPADRALAREQIKELEAQKLALRAAEVPDYNAYLRWKRNMSSVKDRIEDISAAKQTQRRIDALEEAIRDYSLEPQFRDILKSDLERALAEAMRISKTPEHLESVRKASAYWAVVRDPKSTAAERGAAIRGYYDWTKTEQGQAYRMVQDSKRRSYQRLQRFATDDVARENVAKQIETEIKNINGRVDVRMEALTGRMLDMSERLKKATARAVKMTDKEGRSFVKSMNYAISSVDETLSDLSITKGNYDALIDNGQVRIDDLEVGGFRAEYDEVSMSLIALSDDMQRIKAAMQADLDAGFVSQATMERIDKLQGKANALGQRTRKVLVKEAEQIAKLQGKIKRLDEAPDNQARIAVARETITEAQAKLTERRVREGEALARQKADVEAQIADVEKILADPKTNAREMVDRAFDKITGRAHPLANDIPTAGAKAGALKERTLDFLDTEWEIANGFIETNPAVVADSYARQVTLDVQMVQRFGDRSGAALVKQIGEEYATLREAVRAASTDAEARDLIGLKDGWVSAAATALRDSSLGQKILKGSERDRMLDYLTRRERIETEELQESIMALGGRSPWRSGKLAQNVLNVTYAARVDTMAATNLADIARMVGYLGVRETAGNMGRYMAATITDRKSPWRLFQGELSQADRHMLEEWNFVLTGELQQIAAREAEYATLSQQVSSATNKYAGIVSRISGMDSLQRMSEYVILRTYSRRIFEAALAGDMKTLKDFKLDQYPEVIDYIKRYAKKGDDGVTRMNFDDWPGSEGASAAQIVRGAVEQEMRGTTIRRSLADTPRWMQSTTWGKVFGQFQSFAFATLQNAMIRDGQRFGPGTLGNIVLTHTVLGMAILAVKMTLSGTWDRASSNPMWWVMEGLKQTPLIAVPLWISAKVKDVTGVDPIVDTVNKAGELVTGTDTETNLDGEWIRERPRTGLGTVATVAGPAGGLVRQTLDGFANGDIRGITAPLPQPYPVPWMMKELHEMIKGDD